jgi:hypothetical protein
MHAVSRARAEELTANIFTCLFYLGHYLPHRYYLTVDFTPTSFTLFFVVHSLYEVMNCIIERKI